MVCQSSEVGRSAGRGGQGGERAAVEIERAGRGERFLYGDSRQVVPERDPALCGRQHPGGEAVVHPLHRLRRERLEEPEVSLRRHHCHSLDQCASLRIEPGGAGEHSVPHSGRDLLGTGGQHLGHEERVAPGTAVQVRGIDSAWIRQARHGGRRQRLHLQPMHNRAGGQLAEHNT